MPDRTKDALQWFFERGAVEFFLEGDNAPKWALIETMVRDGLIDRTEYDNYSPVSYALSEKGLCEARKIRGAR